MWIAKPSFCRGLRGTPGVGRGAGRRRWEAGAAHPVRWLCRGHSRVCSPHLPELQTVNSASTKSTPSSTSWGGSQRSWFGVTLELPGVAHSGRDACCLKGSCPTLGCLRYSHERRLAWRGTVNAVPAADAGQRTARRLPPHLAGGCAPDSCSAYRPSAQA